MDRSNLCEIREIYAVLNGHFGDLKWWPARTRFEVVAGAILTQNTSWRNVEKAIALLRAKKLLTAENILKADLRELRGAVRCTGYYRQKSDTLKAVSGFFVSKTGKGMAGFRKKGAHDLRKELLGVRGVGPETADSIILYALDMPVFVVDAYTKRIFSRHGIIPEKASYRDVQEMVHRSFGEDVPLFKQFHALLVETAKAFCSKKAGSCEKCPLGGINAVRRKCPRPKDRKGSI